MNCSHLRRKRCTVSSLAEFNNFCSSNGAVAVDDWFMREAVCAIHERWLMPISPEVKAAIEAVSFGSSSPMFSAEEAA